MNADGGPDKLRVAVLISGLGSTLQALLDACADPAFPAQIVIVISNKSDAPGLLRAEKAGIAAVAESHAAHPSREAFERAVDAHLHQADVSFICLAGFMRVLSTWFVARWRGRMINIHPSLLPSFKGLNTHQRAIDAKVKAHGCTVHYVESALDAGPIVAQAEVPVLASDDADTLAARVRDQERRIYPLALKLIASGRVQLVDGTLVVNDRVSAEGLCLGLGDQFCEVSYLGG